MQLYDLRVTVERIEGRFRVRLEVGDYFEVTESSRIRTPTGASLLHVRVAGRPPALAREAATASRFGLARAGLARRLPGSRRAGDHANRAHRDPDTPHRRAHLSRTVRELGLALRDEQADRPDTPRAGSTCRRRRLLGGHGLQRPLVPARPACVEEIARGDQPPARIGPSCLNPFTLHPVEIAGQIAALDTASSGRAFLGLAARASRSTPWVSTSPVG